MAKMTFNIQVECEVETFEEALAQAIAEEKEFGDTGQVEWLKANPQGYPMPVTIHSITCNGQPVKDEAEDHMEHRYLIAGTGGDGYTLSVTHYIV